MAHPSPLPKRPDGMEAARKTLLAAVLAACPGIAAALERWRRHHRNATCKSWNTGSVLPDDSR